MTQLYLNHNEMDSIDEEKYQQLFQVLGYQVFFVTRHKQFMETWVNWKEEIYLLFFLILEIHLS